MTKSLLRQRRVQLLKCDNCFVWVPKDRIVWRGPDGRLAICDECQEAGDDYR